MKSDCEHKNLKCMKCMRRLPGDFEITKIQVSSSDNQYKPATAEFSDGGEGFHIKKGPFMVEVRFNHEGVIVDIWDGTEEAPDGPLESIGDLYASCEDPWMHQIDPQQQELL